MIDINDEEQVEAFRERVAAFAKTMNQLEKKEMRKKVETQEDELPALLWIAKRRQSPNADADFNALMLMTDEELLAEAESLFPFTAKS